VRYLVSITPDPAVIDQVDQSGGVMLLLTWLKETFKPEAFYLEERAPAAEARPPAGSPARYGSPRRRAGGRAGPVAGDWSR
jgi:hypothetical protein